MSDATDGPGRCSFWFDMADADAYDGLVEEVLETIVSAAAASGLTDGHIKRETAPDGDQLRRRLPPVGFTACGTS